MSMNRAGRVPKVPTLPRGEHIASYSTYLEAQKAVDHLSDKEFPVEHVTIVGTDLRMVERVTGRLTWSRVALAGLAMGAWFGLFVGLLLSIFASPTGGGGGTILPAMVIGAAFGILFAVISHSLTGGKRDFTSASQIVAATYAVLCDPEHAHKARALLAELGGRVGPVAPPPAPVAPPAAQRPPEGGHVPPPQTTQPHPTAPQVPPQATGQQPPQQPPQQSSSPEDGRR